MNPRDLQPDREPSADMRQLAASLREMYLRGDEDPCMERRHHRDVHIYLSGRFEPLGGYLRNEAR